MREAREHRGHRPEDTTLHALVRGYFETFLATAREEHERPLPCYVETELRSYLECGILAHGFAWSQLGAWTEATAAYRNPRA